MFVLLQVINLQFEVGKMDFILDITIWRKREKIAVRSTDCGKNNK